MAVEARRMKAGGGNAAARAAAMLIAAGAAIAGCGTLGGCDHESKAGAMQAGDKKKSGDGEQGEKTGKDATPKGGAKTGEKQTEVEIKGREFVLDLALDDQTRYQGLSGRGEIEPDKGMLFIFPDRYVMVHEFVMRDCSAPIDIIYLDKAMRVTATHAMTPEAPKKPEESDQQYNDRLKRYSSEAAAQFVIEIRGGVLEELKKEGKEVKRGEKIALDPDLKRRAR